MRHQTSLWILFGLIALVVFSSSLSFVWSPLKEVPPSCERLWFQSPSILSSLAEFLHWQLQQAPPISLSTRQNETFVLHLFSSEASGSTLFCSKLSSFRRFISNLSQKLKRDIIIVGSDRQRLCEGETGGVVQSHHNVWFVESESLESLLQTEESLQPFPTPSCWDCSTRFLVVGHKAVETAEKGEAAARLLLSNLLTNDTRWNIWSKITKNEEGRSSWFALNQLRITQEEQQFLSSLHQLQTSELPCESQNFIVWKYQSSGFASNLHCLFRLYGFSVLYRRTAIALPDQFQYADPRVCGEMRTLGCYFLSNLLVSEHKCARWAKEKLEQMERTPFAPNASQWEIQDQFWLYQWPSMLAHDSDPKFLSFLHDIGEFYGSLTLLTLRAPRLDILEQIEQSMAIRKPDYPYIGLHVRHGDKIFELPTLVPFSAFMQRVSEHSLVTGINDVYVATDNQTILSEELNIYQGFRFNFLEMERNGAKEGGGWMPKTETPLDMFISVMTDIFVLVESDRFFGTAHSGFTTVVAHLRGALGRHQTFSLWREGQLGETVDATVFLLRPPRR